MRPALEKPARKEPLFDATGVGRHHAGQRTRLFVPSAAWGGRRGREWLLGAAGIAVLLHIAAVTAIIEAPRLLPAFLRAPPPKPPPPPPAAELVMVKQDTPTVGGAPSPDKKPDKTPAPEAKPEHARSGGGAADLMQAPQGPAVPPPAPEDELRQGRQDTGNAVKAPPPAAPVSAAEVNLDIDGQPGWGLADPRSIPASPDDRYVNKPAGYPKSAALRGEQGVVYLTVLIAPDGRAESVQLDRSSGYGDLDRAARSAVAAWRFRPAIRDGVPVQSQQNEAYHFILGP